MIDYFRAVEQLSSRELKDMFPNLYKNKIKDKYIRLLEEGNLPSSDVRILSLLQTPLHSSSNLSASIRHHFDFFSHTSPFKTPNTSLISCSQISALDLLTGLPLHIIACLETGHPQPPPSPHLASLANPISIQSANCFEHVVKAFKLSATLSGLCGGSQLGDSAFSDREGTFTHQLIDAVNLALLTIVSPEADSIRNHCSTKYGAKSYSEIISRVRMVPSALRALAFNTSNLSGARLLNWNAVSRAIFSHLRGHVLLDAAFEACRLLIEVCRLALCNAEMTSSAVEGIAYEAGAAMELVTTLCACPLFYHRMMIHSPDGWTPLRLILECLRIHESPLAAPPFARMNPAVVENSSTPRTSKQLPLLVPKPPPYSTDKGRGAAELLAARGFALLSLLGEYESPCYLDELFIGNANTQAYAKDLISISSAYMHQVLLRPLISQYPVALGESQMSINVLRAAELLTDDSNFRSALIPALAPAFVRLLALTDTRSFATMWCMGTESVQMMGEKSSVRVNSTSAEALKRGNKFEIASREYFKIFGGASNGQHPQNQVKTDQELKIGRHLSLERTILLTKILVNLHYYRDNLPSNFRDAFLKHIMSAIDNTPVETRQVAYRNCVTNLQNLFTLAHVFGAPKAFKGIELMDEVDVEQSKDFLSKIQSFAQKKG